MRTSMKRVLWVILGMVLSGSLMSCQKTEKQSAAGGGSSSQSIMTLRGAAR
jgi:hypothetical protein